MYSSMLARQQFRTSLRLWQMKNSVHLQLFRSPHFKFLICQPKENCLIFPVPVVAQRIHSGSGRHANKLAGDEGEEILVSEIVDEIDAIGQNNSYKYLLYRDEEDDIMKRLNSYCTPKQLNQAVEELGTQLQKEHIVQSIVLHWMYSKQHDSLGTATDKTILDKIIGLLNNHVDSLDINEMSACYLYLRKMGVEHTSFPLEKLLIKSLQEIETSTDLICLPALSRLVVGINTGRKFFTPMLCSQFIKHLDQHIMDCNREEDARLIAICILNLQPLFNNELINSFKVKVEKLLSVGKISASTPKTIIKVLNMLNMRVWSLQNTSLIRELLLALQPIIHQLDALDLKTICRIYQYHMEPACLHEPLSKAVGELLATQISPENLACFVPFSQPHKRETLINAFKAVVSSDDSWQQPNAAALLFITLRGLKISDTKICNAYWNGILNELNLESEEDMQTKLLKHCHRYMNFNNNLGGTYRNMALEKKLSQLCMRAIEHDIAGRIPKKFARLASFVLAYGHTPYSWKKYPNILLSKIITMVEQFTPVDCFLISRGLQISLEMRYRHQMPQLVGMQLSTIDSVLTSCAERYLNDDQLSVSDLNMLVRTLNNRRSLKNSVVYHRTLQKYKEVQCQDLNSRIIKDMAYNFMSTNYFVPEVLEAMFKYLEINHKHVVGETVEKLLNCTYNLGYTPKSYESINYAGGILLRDFNYMSGLSLVQASLALCFYKSIPEELINKVFCVKFIQRVEDEIQICYSKATYPERVLNTVMQLNRSVCLDFPEANVPWFQQNFIEAQISKKPYVENSFSSDVKKWLSTVLKDESYFRCNHTTPYGYQINFVINFDKDKQPIRAPVETAMLDRITKVAILLLKLDSFCANDLNTLRGPDSLKIKHLEMMGYKVLSINEHDWNTKYMNVPGQKTKYLKCLLQITN